VKKNDANPAAAGTSGVVDRVDAQAKTITLKGTKKNEAGLTVLVNDQTRFSIQEGRETRQARFAAVAQVRLRVARN
jgi:hypothetical protein